MTGPDGAAVLRVGLTGGIGSGKSTVARMFADRGAIVIDADRLARAVVEPGQPALAEIAERFGSDLIHGDGTLDRAGLAAIVFADKVALADLEAITHPRIGERTRAAYAAAEADAAAAGRTRIIVVDHPLLVETGLHSMQDVVIVVLADVETRVARLVDRGLKEDDARARMRTQATDDQRRAVADHVIDNNGDLHDLEDQVADVWSALHKLITERVDAAPGGDAHEPNM